MYFVAKVDNFGWHWTFQSMIIKNSFNDNLNLKWCYNCMKCNYVYRDNQLSFHLWTLHSSSLDSLLWGSSLTSHVTKGSNCHTNRHTLHFSLWMNPLLRRLLTISCQENHKSKNRSRNKKKQNAHTWLPVHKHAHTHTEMKSHKPIATICIL